VTLPITVSTAVMDCAPSVFSVKLRVAAPPASAQSAGRTAWVSLLVKCSLPAYDSSLEPSLFLAVTEKADATPAGSSGAYSENSK